MNTYEIGYANQNNGYPMYFQVQEADQLNQKIIDFCHTELVKVGDELRLRDSRTEYVVAEVLEVREPKGEHVNGAMFQRLLCDGGHKQ